MWCEVELERNQMNWSLEEMAVSQLPAEERVRERERERDREIERERERER